MLLRASSRLRFTNEAPSAMVLMLRPRRGDGQWVLAESYDVSPRGQLTEYTDLYGNLCQRLTADPGEVTIESSCDVEVPEAMDSAPGLPATPIEAVPSDVLHYLLPSRYCQSDQLMDAANAVAGSAAPGFDQAEAIRAWVQANVAYAPGSTDSSTSALDTWSQRRGVCRDQAHLCIALCRALDLPARMVVGYMHNLVPMDLHAWYESYIGERWWSFDAKEPTTEAGRIVIGYGRDAADVALATTFGPSHLQELHVTVDALYERPNEFVG